MGGCHYCDKVILAKRGGSKYCGATCRQRYWQKQKTGYRAEHPEYKFKCHWCEREVATNDKRKKYCCKTCSFHAQNAKRKTTKQDRRQCPQCGIEFQPMQKRGTGRTYCSLTCRRKLRYQSRKEYLRSRHWEYRKKEKWGGNWYAALQRDDFTCQGCRVRMTPSQWTSTRRLVVHHLDGTGEHANKNHEMENLMTVCGSCHRKFHTGVNLVFVDGEWCAEGAIFEQLGITSCRAIWRNGKEL